VEINARTPATASIVPIQGELELSKTAVTAIIGLLKFGGLDTLSLIIPLLYLNIPTETKAAVSRVSAERLFLIPGALFYGGEKEIGETRYIVKMEERVETPFISDSAAETLVDGPATR